jgi:hypothetical protein
VWGHGQSSNEGLSLHPVFPVTAEGGVPLNAVKAVLTSTASRRFVVGLTAAAA